MFMIQSLLMGLMQVEVIRWWNEDKVLLSIGGFLPYSDYGDRQIITAAEELIGCQNCKLRAEGPVLRRGYRDPTIMSPPLYVEVLCPSRKQHPDEAACL